MALLAYLVSSAPNLPLTDGTRCAAGWLSSDEILWAYERFITAGIDVIVVTPDGMPPPTETYGDPAFFQCSPEDMRYAASLVANFADHVDDVHLTSQQYVGLGLMGARRINAMLVGRGWSATRAHDLVSRAAKRTWVEEEPLAHALTRELAGDTSDGPSYEEIVDASDAQVSDSYHYAQRQRSKFMAMPPFSAPAALSRMTPEHLDRIDALYVPGGYGSLVDLCEDDNVGRLLLALHRKDAPITAVGHGTAALLSAPDRPDGQWLFEGYTLTTITDQEEDQTPVGQRGMSWRLEVALKDTGAIVDAGPTAWSSHMVVDRHLITGQNPASAGAAVHAMLAALQTPAVPTRTAIGSAPASRVHRPQPSLKSPRQVVAAFLSTLHEGRLDDAMAMVSSRVSVMAPSVTPKNADGGAQLREILVDLMSGISDPTLDVRKVIATSEAIAVVFRVGGWPTDHSGSRLVNRRVDLDHAWRFQVLDGLITDVAAYWCHAQQLRRMDVERHERVATA